MRVATFNVHFWTDRQQRSTVDETIAFLRSLRCDAFVLQEVPESSDTLVRVADALGMYHAFAPASFLGNALLSVCAPRSFEVVPLEVEPAEDSCTYIEARSAFVATLPWQGGSFRLVGTHLDPHSEQDRMRQLELLLSRLDSLQREGLTLLAGDFNSLRLDDYDADALERIRAHRERSAKEPPRGDVMAQLASRGFADLWHLARTTENRRTSAEHDSPEPPIELATCWAGTRIDYICATTSWREHAHLSGCEHVPTQVSDHIPVVVEMIPRTIK